MFSCADVVLVWQTVEKLECSVVLMLYLCDRLCRSLNVQLCWCCTCVTDCGEVRMFSCADVVLVWQTVEELECSVVLMLYLCDRLWRSLNVQLCWCCTCVTDCAEVWMFSCADVVLVWQTVEKFECSVVLMLYLCDRLWRSLNVQLCWCCTCVTDCGEVRMFSCADVVLVWQTVEKFECSVVLMLYLCDRLWRSLNVQLCWCCTCVTDCGGVWMFSCADVVLVWQTVEKLECSVVLMLYLCDRLWRSLNVQLCWCCTCVTDCAEVWMFSCADVVLVWQTVEKLECSVVLMLYLCDRLWRSLNVQLCWCCTCVTDCGEVWMFSCADVVLVWQTVEEFECSVVLMLYLCDRLWRS